MSGPSDHECANDHPVLLRLPQFVDHHHPDLMRSSFEQGIALLLRVKSSGTISALTSWAMMDNAFCVILHQVFILLLLSFSFNEVENE